MIRRSGLVSAHAGSPKSENPAAAARREQVRSRLRVEGHGGAGVTSGAKGRRIGCVYLSEFKNGTGLIEDIYKAWFDHPKAPGVSDRNFPTGSPAYMNSLKNKWPRWKGWRL